MPKTRRLTSLAALLDEALDERLSVGFKNGVNLVEEGVDRRGSRLNLAGRLESVIFRGRAACENLIRHYWFCFLSFFIEWMYRDEAFTRSGRLATAHPRT